jgi:hypothetical protein
VIPCVVALALCAAAGWDWLASAIERRARHAFVAIAAAIVAYLAIVCARVHPYYLDYYGEQVGGAGTVARRAWFPTGWWGEGLASAIEYVNEHAAPNAHVFRDCIQPVAHLGWFREDLWTPMVTDPRAAEWIVVYSPTMQPCRATAGARLVYETTVDGVPLAQVFQRSGAPEAVRPRVRDSE